MPSRRHVLGTLAVGLGVSLAGCVDAAGVLRMDEATTDAILEPRTIDVGVNDEGDDDGIDKMRDIVAAVVETGSAIASGEYPPLRGESPVRFDGEVYALDRTELATETLTDFRLLLDFDDATGAAERSIEALPPLDADWIESILSDRPSGVDAVSGERTFTEDELATSTLVPDPEFDVLRADDERMGVRVTPVETTVTTYEYTLSERLGSAESYAETLETRYRFDLAGLSGDEADVVAEAIDEGGYYAASTGDEAFEGVARTFFAHDPLASDGDEAHWIATYEGATYVAMIDPVRWTALRRDLPREA